MHVIRRDNLPALHEYIKHIKIKNPITQEFNGVSGTYTQQNVEKQRSYNLPEWKSLTEETQHQPPARRGERRRNQEKVVRGGGSLRGRGAKAVEDDEGSPKPKRKPGRPSRRTAQTEDQDADSEASARRSSRNQVPPTPVSPSDKPEEKKPKKKPGRQPGGGQAKSVSSRRLNNTAESADIVDEKAFKNFDYHMDDLDEFTPERCAELETNYWKSLSFNQPMYAADMPGSLFDDSVSSWNVAHLENLLDVLGTKVPGVNTAYLYMGMWKATFAWHLEDVDLYSINYIHFGAPKQWYSISQADARKFEAAMKQVWPVDAKQCDQFLRHKTYLISPDVLQKQYGVKVNKLVHYEGEFVITYPYGYHSGYNLGYNCAESVNFATESWLEFGRIARKCNCEADNVWVDVADIERKLRGEPTPEYYEETDDESDLEDEDDSKLPTPPASIKGGKAGSKKRKRGVKEEAPKKKKKIRIRIRAPGQREPCVMCPNDYPWEPLLPTDNGKKAHVSCALYTPETWVHTEDGKQRICGVAGIDRARLELKCNFCRSKRGACFQCSSKKCTRAFHATCALAAGVLIDAGSVPTFGEDGTEYFEEGYDFRCKYHRPKMPKNLKLEEIESNRRINNYARELKQNDVVQAQYVGGEVFGALVIENRPSELSVLVEVLPEGDRVEIEWKWLCVLDPDDSQRPKPSQSAIAMPEGMNKKLVSVSNRQDGVPSQDDLFNDNPDNKWFEFINIDMPPQGYQLNKHQQAQKLNVDINAPDQLYYYLPRMSTEAKCFFTDKPDGKEHIAKSNFLDRVNPRPTYQYPVQRQSLAASYPAYVQRQAQQAGMTLIDKNGSTKPYIYKPKKHVEPNMMHIDHQALANQRNFLQQSGGQPSGNQQSFGLPQPQPTQGSNSYQGSDPARNVTPVKPFPSDQYYSNKVLPAAFPGEYSQFRRQSQGAQTLQRPASQHSQYVPNYQSVRQQQSQHKHSQSNAPTVPMMSSAQSFGGASAQLYTGPYAQTNSRPSSSYHRSPYGAPLTPATTQSSSSRPQERPAVDPQYLQNLQKYPYLLNSFLRKPEVYESPYPIGGGFSANWLKNRFPNHSTDQRSGSTHTPSASISSLSENARRTSSQWTPPSQRPGAPTYVTPPPPQVHHEMPRKYPQPTYQTPQEFQQQLQHQPSIASRDGAHLRAMRDSGHIYPSNGYNGYHQRNSFGQPYDTAQMWHSPKAPTPSPMSDPNTPGLPREQATISTNGHAWSTLSRPDIGSMGHRSSLNAFNPTLPQMGNSGGHETWRYN